MKKYFTDIDLSRSVGNLLRIGVMLSVFTSLIGFVKLFSEGFTMPKNYAELTADTSEKIWSQFWFSLTHFRGIGIIQLGILFLIFTPLMRIIFALAGYFKERDYTYVVISMIVIGIMIISFVTGFAG